MDENTPNDPTTRDPAVPVEGNTAESINTTETPEVPKPEEPKQPILTFGDQMLFALTGFTEAVNRMTVKMDAVRLELRQANVLETEKMRFNQFMDSMRASYAKLMKKVEKRLKDVGKQEEKPAGE